MRLGGASCATCADTRRLTGTEIEWTGGLQMGHASASGAADTGPHAPWVWQSSHESGASLILDMIVLVVCSVAFTMIASISSSSTTVSGLREARTAFQLVPTLHGASAGARAAVECTCTGLGQKV
eukprot:3067258-Prymnesium_polylepis.1